MAAAAKSCERAAQELETARVVAADTDLAPDIDKAKAELPRCG